MDNKIVVVYPGRFQPFHKGHKQVYDWLKKKFGNVVIATSNKVEHPKSPFNFAEKLSLMNLAGVPSRDVEQVKNPYIASEILRKHNGNNEVLVFAISEKDMAEDPRFSFKPTKSGEPSYLQPFPNSGKGLKPFGDPNRPTGYVITTPTFGFNVLGSPMRSATEVRKQFAEADYDTQAKIIADLFGRYSKNAHNLMNKKIVGASGKPKTVSEIMNAYEPILAEDISHMGELNHEKFGPMLDSFVQFASKKLGIKSFPTRTLTKDDMNTSFAAYNPGEKHMVISTKNRHPMDIFRSVAHELVHHKQNEDGRLGKDIAKEGATGSDIENEANSEAGKIMRWFAKANPDLFKSSYVVEDVIQEGLYDPNIFKAVFLAGGPGSGKDWILKRILGGQGLVEINSDIALEFLMDKAGLDLTMPPEEEHERNIIRGRAKNVTRDRERLALVGRLGIIINGTADDATKIITIKRRLEDLGYEFKMIFVNTSNEVSRERNIERGKIINPKTGKPGRSVPENIRSEKWLAVQRTKDAMMRLFGRDFVEVDNSDDYRKATPDQKRETDMQHTRLFKEFRRFLSAPPTNTIATRWIAAERTKRNTLGEAKERIPSDKYIPSASELEQAKRLGVDHIGNGVFGTGKDQATHISNKGQLVKAPPMPKEKKKKISEQLGFKEFMKKPELSKKKVDPSNRELGKPELTQIYAEETPGQTGHIPADNSNNGSIGATFSSNGSYGGLGGAYSVSINENIQKWMNNPKTQERFHQKYGDRAEHRLMEVALRLNEMETTNATGEGSPPIGKQGKEEIAEKTTPLMRKALRLNKVRNRNQ